MSTVSLLVPMYNSAAYIGNLLNAAARQTEPFDEIICFDDGSQDQSATIAQRYGTRVLRAKSTSGPSHARNSLLRAATCDFVHFHDSDDPLDLDFLAAVKRTGFLKPWTVVISSFDQIRSDQTIHHAFDRSAVNNPFDLVFKRYVHLNAIVVDRHLALAAGGFDETLTLCEEKDFLLRLIVRGATVRIIEETLAEWIIRPTSFMNKHGWLDAVSMLRRFAVNAADLIPASARPGLEQYVMRAAWEYYFAEPACLPEIRSLFTDLARKGIRPSNGLSGKAKVMATVLGPVLTLRCRRMWAGLRQVR